VRSTALQGAVSEALRLAWARFPEAEEIRPQMLTGGEIAVHVWRCGVGRLWHTEVYV
jgi:hypothetical protein